MKMIRKILIKMVKSMFERGELFLDAIKCDKTNTIRFGVWDKHSDTIIYEMVMETDDLKNTRTHWRI